MSGNGTPHNGSGNGRVNLTHPGAATRQPLTDEHVAEAQRRVRLALAEMQLGRLEHVKERQHKLRESGEAWEWIGGAADFFDRFRGGRDGDFTFPISTAMDRRYGANWPFWRTWAEHARIRGAARICCTMNQLAGGALTGLTSFVIGEGFRYHPVPRPGVGNVPRLLIQAVQAVIDEFSEENEWPEMEQELFRRSRRDGESFLRRFVQRDGMVYVRTVEPEWVLEPPNNDVNRTSFGVYNPEMDLQSHLAYWVASDGVSSNGEKVPSEDIDHIKCNVDRIVKRGLSDFSFDTYETFRRIARLLENMQEGGAIQAAIAFVRKHTAATPDQIANFAAGMSDYQQTSPVTGQQEQVERFLAGTILDIDGNQEFTESPFAGNVSGFVELVQAGLRSVAVRWNAPEWLVSADSSNGNYACHDSNTELLTLRGWLRYDEIQWNDVVSTTDPETGMFEWQPIQAIYRYPHAGEMVRIKNDLVDLLVTTNHRMWVCGRDVSWCFVSADELRGGEGLPVQHGQQWLSAYVDAAHISREQYDGTVWCVTVPNGLIITRRYGKTAITGNSSLVAEAPFVRTCRRRQAKYRVHFLRTMRAVVKGKCDSGRLHVLGRRWSWREIDALIKIDAVLPTLEARDKAAEASRYKTLIDAGVTSRQIAAEEQNIDYERVVHDAAEYNRLGEHAPGQQPKPQPSPLAELKGLSGLNTITQLQGQFYGGQLPREAVVAALRVLITGLTQEQAEALFPDVAPNPPGGDDQQGGGDGGGGDNPLAGLADAGADAGQGDEQPEQEQPAPTDDQDATQGQPEATDDVSIEDILGDLGAGNEGAEQQQTAQTTESLRERVLELLGRSTVGEARTAAERLSPIIRVLEAGYTGRKEVNGKHGTYHRCYSNGKPIACHALGSEHGGSRHDEAHDFLHQAKSGEHGLRREHADQLHAKLSQMTLGEIRQLKDKLGVKAGADSKRELISKVVGRAFGMLGGKLAPVEKPKQDEPEKDKSAVGADAEKRILDGTLAHLNEFGTQAAIADVRKASGLDKEEFDALIWKLAKEKKIRVIPASDLRGVPKEHIEGGLPGVEDANSKHSTPTPFLYVKPVAQDGTGRTLDQGEVDQHRAERGLPKLARGETAKPTPTPTPERKRGADGVATYTHAEAKNLPDHEAALSDLADAAKKAATSRSGVFTLEDAYQSLKAKRPGLTTEDFHKQLLQWQADDKLTLQKNNDPRLSTPGQLGASMRMDGPAGGSVLGYVAVRPHVLAFAGQSSEAAGQQDAGPSQSSPERDRAKDVVTAGERGLAKMRQMKQEKPPDMRRGRTVSLAGEAGTHEIVGMSKDNKTVRVRPAKLSAEQKQVIKRKPDAYTREVPAADVFHADHANTLRLLGNADKAARGGNLSLANQILDGLNAPGGK